MKQKLKIIIFFFIIISSMSFSEGSGIFLEVMTDDATIKFQEEEFEASGGILFQYDDIKIKAFKIKKAKEKNVVTAYEKVIFQQGDKTVEADEVEVNLDTKEAVIKNGGTLMDNIFYGGEIFQAKFPDIATVRNAAFSTCNKEEPHYHFEAKKIDFYPGRKIVAYNTFLYIGKQKVMWLPYYVSSVKADGQRATLFPKFGSDEEKGMYVIWGAEYEINKYMKGYLDFQWSKKKGYYINTWSNDYEVNKENTGNLSLKEFRITNDSDKREWDFIWKHQTKSPGDKRKYIKDSNWNFYVEDQTTNLLKDSEGNDIIVTTSGTEKRKNLRKYQIDGTQKLFGDVTATVAVNWMDSEIAKAIIEADEENENGTDNGILKSETDNEITQKFTLAQDNALYGISGSYEKTEDLDPGNKGDYYSYKDNKSASLQLKKYKISLSYTDNDGDTYKSLTGDEYVTVVDYLYKKDKSYSLTLGDYKILSSNFYYGGTYKLTEKDYFRYKYEDDTDADSKKTKDEDDSITSKYSTATAKFGNSAIPLWKAGKMNLAYEYGKIWFAKTESGTSSEGGEELDTHKVTTTISTDIFDNSKNEAGKFDLVVKNEIPMSYSFAKGEAPKSATEISLGRGSSQFPDRVINVGDTVYFNLGNTTNSYNTTYTKSYYGEKDLEKSDKISGNLKLGVLNESINITGDNTKSYYEGLYDPIAATRDYDVKGRIKNNSYNTGLEYRNGSKIWSYNRSFSKGYEETKAVLDSKSISDTLKFSTKKTTVSYTRTNYMSGSFNAGVFDKTTDKDLDSFGITHSFVKELLKKTVEASYTQGNNKGSSNPGKTDGVLTLKLSYEDTSGNKKEEEKKKEELDKVENKNFELSEEEKKRALEILDKDKQAGKFDLQGLGKEKKLQTLDMSKIYTIYLSTTSDREYMDDEKFSFSKYGKSLKAIDMKYTVKYTTWFNWTGGVSLGRSDGGEPLTDKAYNSNLQLQLGTTGAESLIWWIGYDMNYVDTEDGDKIGKFTYQKFYLKKQVTDCTTLEVNFKRNLTSTSGDDYENSYGLAFSINAFPEKGLEVNYENEKMGFGAGM